MAVQVIEMDGSMLAEQMVVTEHIGPTPKAPPPLRPPNCRWLFYGEAGAGKSTAAATWPKPMLVASFDPAYKDMPYIEKGELRIDEATGSNVHFLDDGTPYRDVLKDDGTVTVRVVYFWDEDPDKANAWGRFLRWMYQLNALERRQWRTIVFDSLTHMRLASRSYRKTLNPHYAEPRKYDAEAADDLEGIVSQRLASIIDTNVILIAHVGEKYDEALGCHVYRIKAPGRLAAGNSGVQAGWPEVYRVWAKPVMVNGQVSRLEHYFQTMMSSSHHAMSQLCRAPNPCEPRYGAVWAGWLVREQAKRDAKAAAAGK